MKHIVKHGQTDYTILVSIQDSSSATGAKLAGLDNTKIDISYSRVETDNDVTNTACAPQALATPLLTDPHLDWGFLEVSAAEAPGLYRLDCADGVFAAGAWSAVVTIRDAGANNVAPTDIEFQLVDFLGTDSKALISTDAQDLSATLDVNIKTITAGIIANASFNADVGSTAHGTNIIALAVRKILEELNLDHLLKVTTGVAADGDLEAFCVAGTVAAHMLATGADATTFKASTDSLQGIRDQGDSAWATATGFSTHNAAAVKTAMEADGGDLSSLMEALVNKAIWTEADGQLEMFNDSDVSQGTIAAQIATDGTYTTRKRAFK